MELNGTIFSKPQQDQLRRALESGGSGGGGGSLTKHVVEMTTANYETIKNDFPRMVGATLDIIADGLHYCGKQISVDDDTIYAQAITLGDSILGFIGAELTASYLRRSAYMYGPSESDPSLVSITNLNEMVANATFTLTYWTE